MRHVALLIETSRSYGRGLLRGVRRYAAEYGPWSMYIEQRALDSRVPRREPTGPAARVDGKVENISARLE
jgi:hypothetical protein